MTSISVNQSSSSIKLYSLPSYDERRIENREQSLKGYTHVYTYVHAYTQGSLTREKARVGRTARKHLIMSLNLCLKRKL